MCIRDRSWPGLQPGIRVGASWCSYLRFVVLGTARRAGCLPRAVWRRRGRTARGGPAGPKVGAPGPAVAERDGVLIRPLVLTTAAGDRVPALYLTPNGRPPWPAVVAVHQHGGNFAVGKSEPAGLAGDPDMAYALAMARLGVAALVPDLTAFEGRKG